MCGMGMGKCDGLSYAQLDWFKSCVGPVKCIIVSLEHLREDSQDAG